MYVNSKSDVDQVKSIRDSPKLDNPINISAWMPERPYFSAPDYPRKRDAYAATVQERREEMSEFAGLLLVGGSGPIIDVANNQRVHDIILAFYGLQKPIAAICYGVAALVLLWTLAIAFPSCAENT